MSKKHSHLHVIDHPVIAHHLTLVRDAEATSPVFRERVGLIAAFLAIEATRDLATESVKVDTPLETCAGVHLAKPLTIVPILRAGLGFSDAIHRMLPEAHMGHLGMFRDEKKLSPVGYYQKLPNAITQGPTLLVDPMLATGGSAASAIKLLRGSGCNDIRFICLIAAPEGVKKLEQEAPGVPIYTAALDRELDEHGYIRPGLGDAGDRIFGTID